MERREGTKPAKYYESCARQRALLQRREAFGASKSRKADTVGRKEKRKADNSEDDDGRGTKPDKSYGMRMPSSLRRGLPGGVGGARNLINHMVCEYPPRSGGASLEGWENHET